MNSKTFKLLLISVFLGALIVPVIGSHKLGGGISPNENRYLARFPKIYDENKKLSPELKNGFETWLNDNLGGRLEFIRLYKQIQYRLFGELGFSGQRVIQGPGGWLFFAPDEEVPYIVNSFIPEKNEKKDIRENFERIAAELRDSDISLVVAMWPPKFNVYPEELPSSIGLVDTYSAAKAMDEDLKNATGFSYASSFDNLLESKQSFPTYSRAVDVGHWNQYGAFIGYTALMEAVKQQYPDIKLLTDDDFTITEVKTELTTDWGFISKEIDLLYEPKFNRSAAEDPSFFETINYTSQDIWKSYRYFRNTDTTLPKAIIVGDSYVWQFLLDNMAESFSELVFIHYLDLDQVGYLSTAINANIVILTGQGYPAIWTLSHTVIKDFSAMVVSQDTPTTIERGKTYNISVRVRNTGKQAWSEEDQIRLCIFQDGIDYGYRVPLEDGVVIEPGREYIFVLYNFGAPAGNNTYLEYQMLQEGIQYFGEKERVDIVVK